MILVQWLLNKRTNIKLVVSCTISLGLFITPSVLAAYDPGAQKPVPDDRKSDAGTTRGCFEGDQPLTILASRNYVGRTASLHPTFAWFVSRNSTAKPIKFIIYESVPNGKPKKVREISLRSSPEIMEVSPFSENEPGLQAGKQYLWQVIIQCDPDNPSGDSASEARVEVVGMPASVQSKLDKATNGVEKANIYAQEGLWYDALGEALKLAKASNLGAVGSTLLNDLAQSEAPKNMPELTPKEQGAIKERIETLKQIANSTR